MARERLASSLVPRQLAVNYRGTRDPVSAGYLARAAEMVDVTGVRELKNDADGH